MKKEVWKRYLQAEPHHIGHYKEYPCPWPGYWHKMVVPSRLGFWIWNPVYMIAPFHPFRHHFHMWAWKHRYKKKWIALELEVCMWWPSAHFSVQIERSKLDWRAWIKISLDSFFYCPNNGITPHTSYSSYYRPSLTWLFFCQQDYSWGNPQDFHELALPPPPTPTTTSGKQKICGTLGEYQHWLMHNMGRFRGGETPTPPPHHTQIFSVKFVLKNSKYNKQYLIACKCPGLHFWILWVLFCIRTISLQFPYIHLVLFPFLI